MGPDDGSSIKTTSAGTDVDAVDRLTRAARSGVWWECSRLPLAELASAGAQASIPADAIRKLLRDDHGIDPHGVQLAGARVVGQLDLQDLDSTVRLTFIHCCFDEPVLAGSARLRHMRFVQCVLPGLSANYLQVGELVLGQCVMAHDGMDPVVSLTGARITDLFDLSGAFLANLSGPALYARGATIEGDARMGDAVAVGAREDGAISLLGARISGNLICGGARLTNLSGGPALDADDLHVDGAGAYLTGGFVAGGVNAGGVVSLMNAHIAGELYCDGARLTNSGDGPALSADNLKVSGRMSLDSLVAQNTDKFGTVRLAGAHITRALSCNWSRLTNTGNGPALCADNLEAGSSVCLDDLVARGAGVMGVVALLGAHIAGELSCTGAKLTNTGNGPALCADNLEAGSSVYLDDLVAQGTGVMGVVELFSACITGKLSCTGAKLTNIGDGPALGVDGIRVGSEMNLDLLVAQGVGIGGAVRLVGAHLGRLSCRQAELTNVGNGPALVGDQLEVRQVELGRSTASCAYTGAAVVLDYAQIGVLDCLDAQFRNPRGPILALESATVHEIRLPGSLVCDSTSRRRNVACTSRTIAISGLVYTTLSEADWEYWLHWLQWHMVGPDGETPYAAQPYQQLAAMLKAAGADPSARQVLITQQDRRPTSGSGNQHHRLTHAWQWTLGRTIGYGYNCGRALYGLFAILLTSMLLGLAAGSVHTGQDSHTFVARHVDSTGQVTGSACSTVEQIGLGIDILHVPVIGTGILARCNLNTADTWGQVFTGTGWALQLLAWALATLGIAGYTGLVRRT